MPRRPARPVSWVYSPGVRNVVVLAGELGQLLDHDGARRHVDAHGEGLGGEHHLDQPGGEARLHHLLERRHHAGVVGGDARLEAGQEAAVAEHREVPSSMPPSRRSTISRIRSRSSPVVSRTPASTHGLGGVVARRPAEDEVDRRQHRRVVEPLHHLDPPGRVEPPPAPLAPVAAPAPHRLAVEAARLGVGPAVDQGGQQVEALGRAVAHQVEVLEAHGPRVLHDGRRRAPHGRHPVGQLVGVRHGGRQAHQPHPVGQVDDHLLPHRAAVGVLQEVDLVEDDHAEVAQRPGAAVDHVAQHLGGHDHDRGVAVDGVVAGEQADLRRRRGCGPGRGTSGSTAP